jgi:hypothetical protein
MHTLARFTLVVATLIATVSLPGAAAEVPEELPDPDGEPADMKKPVKVFILMGQSNMLEFGKKALLETAVKEKGKYPYLMDDDGNWTTRKDVRNVRVMCSGSGPWKLYKNEWMTVSGNVGVEIGIGHYVGHVLDAPVMILKSAIGNRSLGYDLLPPSAEGYEGNKDDPTRTPKPGPWYAGVQYDGDTRAAKEVLKDLGTHYPGAKEYEVAGFCFWQGAKDLGQGGNADKYEENLVHFIKDLRKDFNAPNALFVCATMGQAQKGSGGAGGKITDAQLAVDGETGKYPEFKDNVATFYSNPVSMGGSANGHYGGNAETYMNVGEGMGRAMAELLIRGGGSTAGKGDATGTSKPALRPARPLAAGQADVLNGMVLEALVGLTDAGKLTPTRVPLSLTKAKVSLVSVRADNTLTFQSGSGKAVAIPAEKLKTADFANLAILVTKLKPDSSDAVAVAGVYLESLGRVELADKKYEEAGPESTAKMEKFFAP